jgi:hypothetical protein
MVLSLLVVLLGFAPREPSAQPAVVPSASGHARLQVELARVAATVGGRVGVGIRHVESGREIDLNRAERFPMGSVFKLRLAVQLLSQVDKAAVDMDTTVLLQASDRVINVSGPLFSVASDGSRRVLSVGSSIEQGDTSDDRGEEFCTGEIYRQQGSTSASSSKPQTLDCEVR